MKNKIKILIGIIFFCGILTWGFSVSADTIFTDNFNDYNNGFLSGQGGWLASPAYAITVSFPKEGMRAVKASNFAFPVSAVKSGTLLNDGQITVYVRRVDANQPGVFLFTLKEGTAPKIEVRGNVSGMGQFQHINGATGSYINFGVPFHYDTWYAVQIQWRSSDHSARYNIDGGSWTDWTPSIAPWTFGLDTVQLETINAIYWDTIQENLINTKVPVLIVPGLMGTEIKKDGNFLWLNLIQIISSFTDSFMDPLMFNPDTTSSDNSLEISEVIRKEPFADYTDGLITELENQGYIENETLFTFPYDWRYGVSGEYPSGKTNADLLQEKIQEIIAQTGSEKVDVVAHSQGGLVVKKYVVDHLTDHHIGKAIFVGVPNTGAPKAIKVLLEGDNMGIPWLSQAEIKKISENMPAAYDLLPSQAYYNTKGSFVKVIDDGSLMDSNDQTQKDLNYSEFESFLTGDHNLNAEGLAGAESLHAQSFDDFDMRTAGIDLYSINGCKAGTVGTIVEHRFENILGQDFVGYKRPGFTPGDGTVPLESATHLPIDSNRKFYSLKGEHGKMMSQDGSRQQIVNILAGSALEVKPELISQDIAECKLNGKAISVFSPINILATDQHGNRLGNAADGSIVNEIPNAAFEIFGEHKFLYLPGDDGQVYDIVLDGTGDGTYIIKNEDIVNGETIKTQTFSNLPVTGDLTGSVHFGLSGAPDSLTIQQNANSQSETILPSPPEAVIEFDPIAKDLKYSGVGDGVVVTLADGVITLADQAGNITEIKLKNNQQKTVITMRTESTQYNGVAVDAEGNIMVYTWAIDKNEKLSKLIQYVRSKNNYNILAVFNGESTKILGMDSFGKVSKFFNGLKIIKVFTDKGDFRWSY